MKVCNTAVWVCNDGKTLTDDETSTKASFLLGIRGERIKDERAAQFDNADDFLVDEADFRPAPPKPPTVATVMGTTTITRVDGTVRGAGSPEANAAVAAAKSSDQPKPSAKKEKGVTKVTKASDKKK